jgi:hypothetical protein
MPSSPQDQASAPAQPDPPGGPDDPGEPPPPASAQPRGGRFQVTSPVLQGLIALAAYLAVWILADVLTLVIHPGQPQLDQGSMDPNFYTWSLRWWPYAISHGLNPLHTTEIGAPHDTSLAWVTSIPPLAVLALPVTVTAGPIAAFNLLAAISLPVSAWAAFVLCRRLTKRFWPALAGGVVYGFSAYEMNHMLAGQLNLTFSLMLPLIAYLVVRWHEGKISRPAFVVLLAIALVIQLLMFLETFADLTAVLVAAVVVGYAVAGRSGRPVVLRLALLVGLAYVLAVVIASPYLAYALTHVPKGFARSPDKSALDLTSLVVPRPTRTFGWGWLADSAALSPRQSKDGYVGIPLLVLAVALAVAGWPRKLIRFLLILLVVVIVFALGPTLSIDGHHIAGFPWHGLWFLPIARSAFPARFMVFAFLILAVMTALWLAGPPRWRWARWALALLVGVSIVANTPTLNTTRSNLPAFIAAGEYRHYLAPRSTVVVVSGRGNAGMLWQAQTDFYSRLAGGFINAAIAHGSDLPWQVASLARLGQAAPAQYQVRRFRAYLRRAGIAAILVEQRWAGPWPGIFTRFGLKGQAIGGVILFRTAGSP